MTRTVHDRLEHHTGTLTADLAEISGALDEYPDGSILQDVLAAISARLIAVENRPSRFAGMLILDAWIKATISGSFTLDAIIFGTVSGSFTLDSWIGTPFFSFTLDAWIVDADSAVLGEIILGETVLGG